MRGAGGGALTVALAVVLAGCAEGVHVTREDVLLSYEAAAPARRVLVVDLDDTVVDGGFWSSLRLALRLFYGSVDPFPGAPEALRELSRDWSIVFVTARDDSFETPTLAWLDGHGFPAAPVLFSRTLLTSVEAKERYKTAAIAGVAARGLKLGAGVGDKASDVGAYASHGLPALLLLDGYDDPDLDATLARLGIESHAPGCGSLGNVALLVFRRETAWETIRAYLRRAATPSSNEPPPPQSTTTSRSSPQPASP